MATRSSTSDPFASPVNVSETNSSFADFGPHVSPDGLTLYFVSTRLSAIGQSDSFFTTRSSLSDPFGPPQPIASINTEFGDGVAHVTADGLTMYFNSDRPGGVGSNDIWVAIRPTLGDPFGSPTNLGAVVNSAVADGPATLTAVGLTMYFGSQRIGGRDPRDLYVSRRPSTDDPFGAPENLGAVINSPSLDGSGHITPDGRTLYFVSQRTRRQRSLGRRGARAIHTFDGIRRIDRLAVVTAPLLSAGVIDSSAFTRPP